MRDVAETSRASKALIHHHFGSKEELYSAVKNRVIDRYWETQQPQFNMTGNGAKFLVEASRTFFHFCRDNPQVGRLGAWAQLEGDHTPWPGVEKICPLVIERICKAQQEGVLGGGLHPVLLMTALTALVTFWWQFKEAHADQFSDYPHPETLDADYFDQAMQIFLHGAAGPGFPREESKR